MGGDDLFSELKWILHEIEWASRKSSTKATLRRITDLSRDGLRALSEAERQQPAKERQILSHVS